MTSFQRLSSRVSSFAESATLALAAKAKKMKAEGRDIVNFSVGEPDFNTPNEIIEFAFKKAAKGETKYTAVAGTPSLRKVLCQRIQKDYGLQYSPEECLVSNGGKQSIFHFLQAVLEPGDEVMILKPYWTSFPEMVKLAGGKPVVVANKDGRPDFDAISRSLSLKTKAFILNSPSNPSGLVWNQAELEQLLSCLEEFPTWILSDDTYYQLVYEPAQFRSVLQINPNFRERTCIVGSTSKSYAMTGWRLGWALGPEHLMKAMAKIQGQVTSNPSSISQAGAQMALEKGETWAEEFRLAFKRRRDLVMENLKSMGLGFYPPEGAFYCFIELGSLLGSGQSVAQFCGQLLDEKGVCLVPGEAFGEPDFARLSYALGEAEIQRGLDLLKTSLKS